MHSRPATRTIQEYFIARYRAVQTGPTSQLGGVEKGLARLSYRSGTEGPLNAEPTSATPKHTATNPTSASAERVGAPRLRFLASSYDLSSSLSADARATIPLRAVVVPRSSRRGAKALSGILEPVWCNSVRPNQDRPDQALFFLPANDSRRVRSASLCGLRSSPTLCYSPSTKPRLRV